MSPKAVVKSLVLALYVYVWASVRNAVRALRGRCHITVLMYHRVSDEFSDDVTVGVERFRQQIGWAKRRYRFADMCELLAERDRPRRRPVLAVTFDDGYADNHAAARFLRDEGISGVFFVSTRIVGTDKAFPHDMKRLGRRVPSLTWCQVQEMASWGHHTASHTAEHPNLGQMQDDEALDQVRLGQEDLRERLGERDADAWFAYPHGRPGDLPAGVRRRLGECGIRFCFSAYGGVNFPGFPPDDIRRQGINGAFGKLAFLAALEGWRTRLPQRHGAEGG